MSEKEVADGCRVGGDIECLSRADPGKVASRNVSHDVPAGLMRRDPHRTEPPHQIRGFFEMHEVQLDVLPSRHVQDRVRILLRDLCHYVHLIGRESTERILDADHAGRIPQRSRPLGELGVRKHELPRSHPIVALAIVVPLAVYAPAQTHLRKYLIGELSRPLLLNLPLEGIDLTRKLVA